MRTGPRSRNRRPFVSQLLSVFHSRRRDREQNWICPRTVGLSTNVFFIPEAETDDLFNDRHHHRARKERYVFDDAQKLALEAAFTENAHPSFDHMQQLAARVGVDEFRVQVSAFVTRREARLMTQVRVREGNRKSSLVDLATEAGTVGF